MALSLKLHRMELPREVVIGGGTIDLVSEVCGKLGFSRSAFIVTGPRTCRIAGHRVMELLGDSGLEVGISVVNFPTAKEVGGVEREIRSYKPQVVLGVGGGTKIDVAKLASAHLGIPFISIPTTASHDGIASPLASIKGLNKPYSVRAQSPIAIIADTHIIARSQHRFVASGCGDVIAKLTAVRDWELAHKVKNEYYGEYAANLSLMSSNLIVKNAELIGLGEEEGIRVLLEALISCGVAMCIAGSSRPCSGSEHLFSHALDLIAPKPAMHGEQCGVGTIMMARLHRLDWKRVRKALETVGAPTTADELGIDPQHVIEALVRAQTIRPERYTILEEKKLDYESAEGLARATGVIN